MHFFATCMVALGSIFSAVWIVVANSWQQTPRHGFRRRRQRRPRGARRDHRLLGHGFQPVQLSPARHTLLGAYILGGFFVMSISAWYLLRDRHLEFARRSFTVGLAVATVASLLQLVSGHLQAKMVGEHQPAKLAAFEGHFKTENHGTGLYLSASRTRRNSASAEWRFPACSAF